MALIKNMSNIDRFIRFFLGAGFFYLGFFFDITDYTVINGLIGLFGAVNMISATISVCPVYTFAGISSCNKSNNE